jgi:type VI secretion system protein ImpM
MPGCGFYGKIPSEGDFVTRRLPWEFTSAWDDWLQQGMLASREALGARWLALYLSAPIWRFQLAPGVCGPQGWRGLFFASVDRVGRYFPLTLAFVEPPGATPSLQALSDAEEAWRGLEDAALQALTPTLAIDDFDRVVGTLAMPACEAVAAASSRLCLYTAGSEALPAVGWSLDVLPQAEAFVSLLEPADAPPAPSSIDLP